VALSSSKAAELWAEVEKTRKLMIEADAQYERLAQIAQNGAFRNGNDTFGQKKAAYAYAESVQQYHAALVAWVKHVLDS
jgi:hypothetical protein